jgi:hypothetical protein
MLGAFGSGSSLPRIRFNNDGFSFRLHGGANDWRIVEMELQGAGHGSPRILGAEGTVQDFLVLRTKVIPGSYHVGFSFSASTLNYYGAELHDGVFLVENDWRDFGDGDGGNIVFMAARRIGLLGNIFDDSTGGEHIIRITHGEKGVVSYNVLGRQAG